MIAYLEGDILHKGDDFVVLRSGSVGYKVFLPQQLHGGAVEGEHVTYWTHQAFRDNAVDLYGFENPQELFFFELLITVSGIGPKTALGILNVAPIETLQQAVIENETAYLTKVSGIGKKNAEKIVLELRDKIGTIAGNEHEATSGGRDDIETLEALQSLGYTQKEARDVLGNLPHGLETTEEKVREALKRLGS